MIHIGAVYGGPELEGSAAYRTISAVRRALEELRGPFEDGTGPATNVVFFVPGSLDSPDWSGARDARFSRKRQLLMVQVAIPANLVGSPDLRAFLVRALHDSNAIAVEVFRKKGFQFPLSDAECLVDKVRQRLESQPSPVNGEKV